MSLLAIVYLCILNLGITYLSRVTSDRYVTFGNNITVGVNLSNDWVHVGL